jgi:hypothetical protein
VGSTECRSSRVGPPRVPWSPASPEPYRNPLLNLRWVSPGHLQLSSAFAWITFQIYCIALPQIHRKRDVVGATVRSVSGFKLPRSSLPPRRRRGRFGILLTRCGWNLCFPRYLSSLSSSLKDIVKVHVPDDPLSLLHAVSQPGKLGRPTGTREVSSSWDLRVSVQQDMCGGSRVQAFPKITLLHDHRLGKCKTTHKVSIGVSIGGQTSH